MFKSLLIGSIAFLFLAWVFTACRERNTSGKAGTASGNRPVLMVSIPSQIFFVRNIAGDRVEVESLLNGSTDPETFEPSIAQIKALADADAFLMIGTLPFEKSVVGTSGKDNVYNVGAGIEYLYDTHGSHSHGETHTHSNMPDPHVWSSPVNARIIALNVLNALVEIDPKNEDIYRANYGRLDARLDSIIRSFEDIFATENVPKSFVVWHPSLSYFARDFGLNQIALNHAGKESSVKGYVDRLENAKKGGSAVYFYQQEFDSDKSATIARDAGVRIIEINPMSEEWEDEIQKIYDAFTLN